MSTNGSSYLLLPSRKAHGLSNDAVKVSLNFGAVTRIMTVEKLYTIQALMRIGRRPMCHVKRKRCGNTCMKILEYLA
jgi:hypothetical protein